MRDRQHRAAARHGDEAREIASKLRTLQAHSGHNLTRIWDDWVSSMALAIANKVDKRESVWQPREDEYMAIVKRHGSETMLVFREMLHMVIAGLEDNPTDLLGGIFMALEMGSDHAGQFFTPIDIAILNAKLTMDPEYLRAKVASEGFITMNDPCIGGGAMVIPVLEALYLAELNPVQHLHLTGQDIDGSVLRMAYVQLSLLGVPAVLWRGDTLRMQFYEAWYTPAHVFFGWGPRLRARDRRAAEEPEAGETPDEAVAELAPEPESTPDPIEVDPPSGPAQRTLFGEGW
jgi:hypothetical protein